MDYLEEAKQYAARPQTFDSREMTIQKSLLLVLIAVAEELRKMNDGKATYEGPRA